MSTGAPITDLITFIPLFTGTGAEPHLPFPPLSDVGLRIPRTIQKVCTHVSCISEIYITFHTRGLEWM
jgi:hypothetical protein